MQSISLFPKVVNRVLNTTFLAAEPRIQIFCGIQIAIEKGIKINEVTYGY